ncbi:MAG: exosortase family protein XrtF [Chlorobi bacterium]|nr:exosortase family protein XrtF [Chlorobiota bacterium]
MGHTRQLLLIVVRFFLFYFLFLFIYNQILSRHTPDPFTLTTAKQVNAVYRFTGYRTEYQTLENPAEIGIREGNRWFVKIIEGCNGMSVIFVFLAFVWAFPAPRRQKLIFSLAGVLLIWVVNILRIYILGLVYRYRPEWFDFGHKVLFPASIYGMVVLLWVVWLRRITRRAGAGSVNK